MMMAFSISQFRTKLSNSVVYLKPIKKKTRKHQIFGSKNSMYDCQAKGSFS